MIYLRVGLHVGMGSYKPMHAHSMEEEEEEFVADAAQLQFICGLAIAGLLKPADKGTNTQEPVKNLPSSTGMFGCNRRPILSGSIVVWTLAVMCLVFFFILVMCFGLSPGYSCMYHAHY